MRTHTRSALALLTLNGALAVGCGGTDEPLRERVAPAQATLHRAQSCDELLTLLRADALAKLHARIDQEIEWARLYGSGGTVPMPMTAGGVSLDDGATKGGESAGAPAPTAGGANGGATSHSETNTQVAGVDEADLVKTDGKSLFVLHGASLRVITAWPATSLAAAQEIAIEGDPSELFVEGGRALVYSTVNGASVFAAAGVAPRSAYADYGYGYGGGARTDVATSPPGGAAGGSAGGSTGSAPADGGSATTPPAPDAPPPAGDDEPGDPGGVSPAPSVYIPLTKATTIDLTGATPTVVSERYWEGSYQTSRRVGTTVRTVLQGGDHGPVVPSYPTFPGGAYPTSVDEVVAAWEALRAEGVTAIEAAGVEAWLPYRFSRTGSTVTASSPACSGYYVPTAGTTQYGLTQLAVQDLVDTNAYGDVSIVGRADTVYSNASTLVLAATAYDDAYVAYDLAVRTDPTAPIAVNRTHLHTFDLTGSLYAPTYIASGTVLGSVKNQFSVDEAAGVVRVATTEDRAFFGVATGGDVAVSGGGGAGTGGGTTEPALPPTDAGSAGAPSSGTKDEAPPPPPPSRVNHVYTLAASRGTLGVVGHLGDLAPEERIYSTRYVGDRAYVVTYRQVDPLFVIDLANPAQPTLLGELKIPGFSEYMHPLDASHLLTIGKETTVDAYGNVSVQGVALQIFDVSNAASPALAHKFVFPDTWGGSAALYDHKAFTYFAEKKKLAFPYYGSSASAPYGMWSTLEVFDVDTTAGLSHAATIDHSAFFATAPGGYCGGYYGVDVRRGVFLDDYVYSVSYGGVEAHALADLTTAVASLPLPPPPSYSDAGWGAPCAMEGAPGTK